MRFLVQRRGTPCRRHTPQPEITRVKQKDVQVPLVSEARSRNRRCSFTCGGAVTSTTQAWKNGKRFYQLRHASLSCYTQINELPDLKRALPTYQELPSHVLQDVLRRLDKAFTAFFRRIRNGEMPGYPRFKSTSRYHSFTYPDVAGWKLQGNLLHLAGVGDIQVKLHRELQGTIKTVTIRRDIDQWYVTFSCEVPEEAPLPSSEQAVGLDLGVMHFATLSTGEQIENPRHYRKGLKRIKGLSQIKDRRKKGSHRRKRAAIALAKAHRKVRNQREASITSFRAVWSTSTG